MSTAAVVGTKEGEGPLADKFDVIGPDDKFPTHKGCEIFCNGKSKTASLRGPGFLSPHEPFRQVLSILSIFRKRCLGNTFDGKHSLAGICHQFYIYSGFFRSIL